MTYLMHGLRAVSVTPWTCRRRPSLVIILTHAKCSNARRSRWQTNSAVQVTTHESKVNGPVTTRPAPLATRARGEGESLPVYLFKLGKSYISFYKTGLQNIWTNYRQSRRIRHLIAAQAQNSLAQAISSRLLSRADFQLLHRTRHDLLRLPVFALLYFIFGSLTPLVQPYVTPIVPLTCRLPSHVVESMHALEQRRRSSFRELTVAPPPLEEDTTTTTTTTTNTTTLDSLKREQLLHITTSLNLLSPLWPSTTTTLPFLPPRRHLLSTIRRHAEYLDLDDALIRSEGDGLARMLPDEVNFALVERGLDVTYHTDAQRRALLTSWLTARAPQRGYCLWTLFLTRPSIWANPT